MQPHHQLQALVLDWLETSGYLRHQPWRWQTGTTKPLHSALELDWRVGSGTLSMSVSHLPTLWHSCTDWPVQPLPLWPAGGSCVTTFNLFRYKFIFQGHQAVLYLFCDCLNCNSWYNRIDYDLQRFDEEVPFPLFKTEEQYVISSVWNNVRLKLGRRGMTSLLGIPCFERGEVGLWSKPQVMLTIALRRRKRSLSVDTPKIMLETCNGKVVDCTLTKFCWGLAGSRGSNPIWGWLAVGRYYERLASHNCNEEKG